jgi:tetratricopeptide (TPR) repeat protein
MASSLFLCAGCAVAQLDPPSQPEQPAQPEPPTQPVQPAPAAQPEQPPAPPEPPTHSDLDGQLFYQLLIGEMELRGGQAGSAYQIVLDAARKTRSEQLYRRATDIALQARAGEQALAAVRMWRDELPMSLDANRYLVQLLIALNRPQETVEPLQSLLQLSPPAERAPLIMSLPRFFARLPDRSQVAGVLEQALQPHAEAPATRIAVRVSLGRAWLAAGEPARALPLAQRAHADDPAAEAPVLLALELMPTLPAAETIVRDFLQAHPKAANFRMAYARVLANAQRYGDAVQQLDQVTREEPQLAPAWLTLGALHLELRQPQLASAALERFVALVQEQPPVRPAGDPHATLGDDDTAAGGDRGLTQAWLMLAQAAEQRNDFQGAEAWLQRVDNPQRALEVIQRRASLMARQGRLSEARELIARAPERSEEDGRAKLLAEAQVLRDTRHWSEANDVLARANRQYPDDTDLLYEQSMMAEKLDRVDEMERLLRRVIQLKPDHHHAYNALGYSLADRNVRLTEAKALIQKALEMAPGEPFITDSLGWVEYRIGNHDEALRLLRSAYQSRPDPEIAAHLGEVLWVSGQRDEARRIWREARSRDAANDVLRETLARLRVGEL